MEIQSGRWLVVFVIAVVCLELLTVQPASLFKLGDCWQVAD